MWNLEAGGVTTGRVISVPTIISQVSVLLLPWVAWSLSKVSWLTSGDRQAGGQTSSRPVKRTEWC